ncbi:nucleolus and neural progenitor protein [Gastrophryne carolinensis]
MAAEPWNRLNLPRPAFQCQVTLPLSADTGKRLQNLVKCCRAVQSLLKNKALNIDVAALDSILYVYHHRLCCHKNYLALKQVQQCIKRLRGMGLEDALQEILDLCPKNTDLETTKCCSVPSQPIIELASMKILGACKLLMRLMDSCCKCFHICLQQLNLEEYIVLNVVLLALLSRLWVMFRGLLKLLITLYSAQMDVQLEVSAFQKMPYFKGFEFPARIEDHLNVEFSDLFKKFKMFSKKNSFQDSSQLLSKIFKTTNVITEEKKVPPKIEFKKPRGTGFDLGQKVQRLNQDKLAMFDVKALLRSVEPFHVSETSLKRKLHGSKNSTTLPRSKGKCMKHLAPKIRTATSFKELAENLLDLVKWCRKRKRNSEAMFFSLKRKLRSWKKSICHSLREGKLKADYLKTYLRIQRRCRTWNRKVSYSRKHKPHKCHIIHSKSLLKRTHLKSLCLELLSGDQKVSPVAKDTVLRPQTSKPFVSSAYTRTASGRLAETDDIDDIFSSIGI